MFLSRKATIKSNSLFAGKTPRVARPPTAVPVVRFKVIDDLWRLLVVITVRKAADLKKRENRVKRGGGRILGQGGLGGDHSREPVALELIAGDEPTPDFVAELAEQFQRRLDRLGDATLQRVALLRLEGYDYDEIAEQLGVARRTVARKLEMIRDAWSVTPGGGGAV